MVEQLTNDTRQYFELNAESWLLDAYQQSGYSYPTPRHRVRVALDLFSDLDGVSRIVDLGCGGGHLAFALADKGYRVTGVDQSDKMLEFARDSWAKQDERIRRLVDFRKAAMEEIADEKYDAVTAMGVVGYLPDDDTLFKKASGILADGGYLVVSFRNRLFNLYSISERTIKEIATGEFLALAQEAWQLYQAVDHAALVETLRRLHHVTGQLLGDESLLRLPNESPAEKSKGYTNQLEPRQSTPAQVMKAAVSCGYENVCLRGIHPHLTVPGLNQVFPPQVYNRLCDGLIPLESSPISLLWSSVFIGVFRLSKRIGHNMGSVDSDKEVRDE